MVCIFIQVAVPFYGTFETCLRSGLFLAAAAFPMTSRLIYLAPEGDEGALFYYASISLALIVPFFFLGATLAFVRLWVLAGARRSPATGTAARYAAAAAPRPIAGPSASASGTGSANCNRPVVIPVCDRDRENDAGSTGHIGDGSEGTPSPQDRPGAGDSVHGLAQLQPEIGGGPVARFGSWPWLGQWVVAGLDACGLLFFVECQYEIRARMALRRHCDVAAADAIYRDAMLALPHSVYVRIHYALFIRHYKGDTAAAAQRMRSAASAGRVSFDMRYLVFEKQRLWDQVGPYASL
eukprot:tig00000455_g1032.t1